MKNLIKDIFIFVGLLGIAFVVIYFVEGDKFKFNHLFNESNQETNTQKTLDKTDSVINLVDQKILEVKTLKQQREETIDSLRKKIDSKDFKSKKDLNNLKNQLEAIEKAKDSVSNSVILVHKAYAMKKPDTAYVVKYQYDTVYNTVYIHDTVSINYEKSSSMIKPKQRFKMFRDSSTLKK